MAKLRYIYLLHYTSSPLTNVHDRDEDVLFHLRTLPSFRRLVRLMVEGQVKPTKQFATALREENSDDALAVLLQQATEDRDRFELQRQVALAAYTPLQRLFKDSRGQKSLDGSDLLVSLFSGELRSHAEELVQIFRRAEPTTLTSSFTLILAVLDRFTGEEVTESLLEKLQNLEQQYQGLQASFEQARRRGETSKQNLQNLELLSILGSSQRGGHIDALVKQATDLDRGFTAIVQQVADILADLFR